MSLKDSLFSEDVECDVTLFSRDKRRKRVLVFPPVNNYRRFIIHQLVQDRFPDLLHTFSIGQGADRRTVVCYKSDVIRDPKLNGVDCNPNVISKQSDSLREMGVEGRRSPSASPDRVRLQRQVKTVPKVEIYRPPAARRAKNDQQIIAEQVQVHPTADSTSSAKSSRQRRPDRAVYVPRHRRSLEPEGSPQPVENSRGNRTSRENLTSPSISHGNARTSVNVKKLDSLSCKEEKPRGSDSCDSKADKSDFDKIENNLECEDIQCLTDSNSTTGISEEPSIDTCNINNSKEPVEQVKTVENNVPIETRDCFVSKIEFERTDDSKSTDIEPEEVSNHSISEDNIVIDPITAYVNTEINIVNEETIRSDKHKDMSMSPATGKNLNSEEEVSNRDVITNQKNKQTFRCNMVSDVLIISDPAPKESKKVKETCNVSMTPPEKKVKKVERPKSKPAPPPSPPVKINRDECDWDSLFDDNGDCLDPTLIEELTAAVGEVTIEQPKNDYKAYTKHIEVSSDEFAHVIEIYNFPSEYKTSDLAAVFSPFKNGGFELKWVDDTHCLGVFSSPLVAAEVLASDHPFVKTRPLSEATALSKTKAKRSAEFLQPYRSRPETCAALARRLVTGALGVRLATARQEREHEKNILREAKEKRRLANKQREDAWEGIIPEK